MPGTEPRPPPNVIVVGPQGPMGAGQPQVLEQICVQNPVPLLLQMPC